MRVRHHLKKADKSPSPSSILDATPSLESMASTLSSRSKGSRKRKADWVSVWMSGIKRELDTDFQAKLLPEKKPKQSRWTSKQKHEADARKGREKRKKVEATKDATMSFAAEEKKRKAGDKTALSAQQVADKVNKEHRISVTRFTIRRYVEEDRIGESPKKCGLSGWLPDHVYKVLLSAVGSWMKLHQLEGIKTAKQKDLIDTLKKAFEDCDHMQARELAKWILRDTAHLLDARKANQQEARRTTLEPWGRWNKAWRDGKENIDIKDTELGRERKQKHNKLIAAAPFMSRSIDKGQAHECYECAWN